MAAERGKIIATIDNALAKHLGNDKVNCIAARHLEETYNVVRAYERDDLIQKSAFPAGFISKGVTKR